MTFRAPVRDLDLALRAAGHSALLAQHFPALDDDTAQAVLTGAAAFVEGELAPLNRTGDVHGARLVEGQVQLPPGFASAYRALVDGGWCGLSAEPEHGGQGFSKALELAVAEMVQGANLAFGLGPMLTQGAIEALSRHGTARQRALVLPQLVSGRWAATMNLTEPQAGTDLAAVSTRAEPDGLGGFRLTGEKIFITWGDHDATENICHLVLARLPDAPPGVKGISLFLASKYLLEVDGALGQRNALYAASLEHKLGIHGSPTCVMVFEGAAAELVGQANHGLAQMFTMMNVARLQVGVQGVAIAERAFQQALAYSVERRQGRAVWAPHDVIYGHPDVRRSLMLTKAKISAGRGLCLYTGVLSDRVELAATEIERERSRRRQELLTPIAKAWCTDMAVDAASTGLQIHGGMGFIEETGAAQHYRDARILPIYEGTNGVQAIDLVGRKLRAGDCRTMHELCAEMLATCDELREQGAFAELAVALALGVDALQAASTFMIVNPGPSALAGASAYLKLAGDVLGGWVLARQALMAGQGDDWSRSKTALARLFASQVLSHAPGLAAAAMAGDAELAMMSAQSLAP